MKSIFQSKTFWFNTAMGIVSLAVYITTMVSPAIFTSAGIPQSYVTHFYGVCGVIVMLGNWWIRMKTTQPVTLTGKAPTTVILLLLCLGANSQTISIERLNKYPAKRMAAIHPAPQFTASLAGNIPLTGKILSLEPSFGLNALTIQKGLTGWESSGVVAPSFTYGLSVGEYTTSAAGMNVVNWFTAGAGIAAGIIPQSVLSGSFQSYGFITIYNYATIGAGYDAVTKKPFFGLSASVPMFTFKQGLGSYILKLF